jgi:hypothetical protein
LSKRKPNVNVMKKRPKQRDSDLSKKLPQLKRLRERG